MKYVIPPETPTASIHGKVVTISREESLRRRHITDQELRELALDGTTYVIRRYSGSQVRCEYKGKEWKSCRSNKFILRLFLEVLRLQETLATLAQNPDEKSTNQDAK